MEIEAWAQGSGDEVPKQGKNFDMERIMRDVHVEYKWAWIPYSTYSKKKDYQLWKCTYTEGWNNREVCSPNDSGIIKRTEI